MDELAGLLNPEELHELGKYPSLRKRLRTLVLPNASSGTIVGALDALLPSQLVYEHETITEELRREKERFFYYELLLETLQEASLDDELLPQLQKELEQAVCAMQTLNYFTDEFTDTDSSVRAILPGLDILTHTAERAVSFDLEGIIAEIERRLHEKASKLSELTATCFPMAASSIESNNLFLVINQQQHELNNHTKSMRRDLEALQKVFLEYSKTLAKIIEILKKLIVEIKLGSHYRYDSVAYQSITKRCNTMILKLAVLKNYYLRETYNSETNAALRVIKSHLDAAYREALREEEHISSRLAAYESIGPGLVELSKEYAAIIEEIQKKQWTLAQLTS